MNTGKLITFFAMLFGFIQVNSQETDTLYIQSYPQKIRLMGYVSTSFIQVDDGDKLYTPNYPLTTGVGFAIKNTIFGAQAGYGFIPLKDQSKYGKSKMLGFQLHNYGRKMIFDIFLENYKGFYSEKKLGEVDGVFPNMSVLQIGGDATYLFNGKRFSSKAAFDLNEIQLQSAGSWLLGCGTYYFKIKELDNSNSEQENNFENIQLGVNAGYAYSWVINDRWILSGMVKGGANFGNIPKEIKNGKIEVYPTAFARFASNYHKKDWGISMVIIIGNKSVYPVNNDNVSLTNVVMQLSYVKHLDQIFKRKK